MKSPINLKDCTDPVMSIFESILLSFLFLWRDRYRIWTSFELFKYVIIELTIWILWSIRQGVNWDKLPVRRLIKGKITIFLQSVQIICWVEFHIPPQIVIRCQKVYFEMRVVIGGTSKILSRCDGHQPV